MFCGQLHILQQTTQIQNSELFIKILVLFACVLIA